MKDKEVTFKEGDKLRCVNTDFLVHQLKLGANYIVSKASSDYVQVEGVVGEWLPSRFEPALKTFEDLRPGDVVVNDSGNEYTVADAHGRVVELEDSDGHLGICKTIKEMKDHDWTVKQEGGDEAELDLMELTLQDIAKQYGVPVEKIRVKD